MKVGILTFHNAHNYGAVLQAYALREKLRVMGYDAFIINYRNTKIEASYQKQLLLPKERLIIWHPRVCMRILAERRDTKYAQQTWELRCNKFTKFIEGVLLEGDNVQYDKKELDNLQLDAIIFGSDQIWTEWLTGGADNIYFGDINNAAYKIAYGASRYNAVFTLPEKKYFKEKLKNFKAISVREQELANALSEICGLKVYRVIDPTLLLEQADYHILEKSIQYAHFVLAYFLTEDKILMCCAKWIAQVLGIKLIEIHYYKKWKYRNHNQISDCDPGEFLSYFHKASFVLTNSFHGVIFSLIYQKQFYCVYTSDNRKDSLLKLLEIEDRHIKSKDEIDLSQRIDFQKINRLVNDLQKEAEQFLTSALE